MHLSSMKHIIALLGMVVWGSSPAADMFAQDQPLTLSLSGPFSQLFSDREGSEYRSFELGFDGAVQQVSIRLRGNSRRRVCDFPPLRLDFSDATAEQAGFPGQGRLKLVTHCRNHPRGEQDLLEEFLAYRILNVLTDFSLRVRLLHLTYLDHSGRLPASASPRYGFVLEPVDALARRVGSEAVDMPGVPLGGYDLEHAALMYVFQYLIGNTDWSLLRADEDPSCCHNLELFVSEGQVVLVPYDFDLSGLVNARYAFPDPGLGIRRVTQRLYRGICTEREILQRAVRTTRAKRDEILDLVHTLPGLEPGNVKKAEKYIERFFDQADDEGELIELFERRCR
jgi:hypothetical protein